MLTVSQNQMVCAHCQGAMRSCVSTLGAIEFMSLACRLATRSWYENKISQHIAPMIPCHNIESGEVMSTTRRSAILCEHKCVNQVDMFYLLH